MLKTSGTLILASSSPRRRELLTALRLTFEIKPADCDETPHPSEFPEAMVKRLAQAKAQVVSIAQPDAWVLGADTTVVVDGEILGKPEDDADAARMLALIQGRRHVVWGGAALLNQRQGVAEVWGESSEVEIAPMTTDLISDYIATREPYDKAGAYAIQGVGAQFVTRVFGSYTNVVGLNVSALLQVLRKYGVVRGV